MTGEDLEKKHVAAEQEPSPVREANRGHPRQVLQEGEDTAVGKAEIQINMWGSE